GVLNRTALLFLSDHGMRWGNIRSTYVGMLEERLPYVFLYLPHSFRDKYKQAFRNLQNNAHKLTSNYDIYETLLDIAHLRFMDLKYVNSTVNTTQRGISLFKNIPDTRTCGSAGIPTHFCTCQATQQVDMEDPVLKKGQNFLLSSINKDLKNHSLCMQFTHIKVITARISTSSHSLHHGSPTSSNNYLLQAKLMPGEAEVEATLQYDKLQNNFQLRGEISRINKYGNQSHCIKEDILRKLCICKDVLISIQRETTTLSTMASPTETTILLTTVKSTETTKNDNTQSDYDLEYLGNELLNSSLSHTSSIKEENESISNTDSKTSNSIDKFNLER
ncbi:unnamed protein product, partial [Meganyctiphanes norvegica]